jgi:hypothetical protein
LSDAPRLTLLKAGSIVAFLILALSMAPCLRTVISIKPSLTITGPTHMEFGRRMGIFFISTVIIYEDGTGRHAVRLQLEPGLREYKEYYLMYDTNNVRVEVIKGKSWHQFHI